MSDLLIRHATQEDAAAIGDIYNHYILNSHATFQTEPRDEGYWRDWLAQFSEEGRHQAFVLDQRETVDGFAVSARFNERQAYGRTVITSIYLRHTVTGGGLGGRLYDALFDALESEDVHRALAWISMPNDASAALHRRYGFRDIGTMTEAGFKFGRYIDVLMMEKRFQ